MVDPIKAIREAAAEAARLTMLGPTICGTGEVCSMAPCACAQAVADAALIAGLRARAAHARTFGAIDLAFDEDAYAAAIEAASGGGADGPAAATVAPKPPV